MPKMKILIADDSRVHVHLLTGWLQDRGFEVVEALDAVQAWMKGLRSQPNLIVLDLNMPGGSGIDVLKRLKTSVKTKHIPVLVVSGNSGLEIRDLVRRLGAADLLEKPLDQEQFCTAVAGLVARPLESAP
jgi:CheY-like chemotaxis protein